MHIIAMQLQIKFLRICDASCNYLLTTLCTVLHEITIIYYVLAIPFSILNIPHGTVTHAYIPLQLYILTRTTLLHNSQLGQTPIQVEISLFCFYLHLFFLLAILFFLTYCAQDFAGSFNVLLKVKLYSQLQLAT